MKSLLVIIFITLLGASTWAQTAGPNIGLKNFRSIYFSMARVTGIKPTDEIRKHYQEIMSRFPKDGRINEFSASVVLAQKDLAGLFCKEFAKTYQEPGGLNVTLSNLNVVLSDLSERFYQRAMSQQEAKMLTDLVAKLRPQTNRDFIICSAMLGAEEFLVQK